MPPALTDSDGPSDGEVASPAPAKRQAREKKPVKEEQIVENEGDMDSKDTNNATDESEEEDEDEEGEEEYVVEKILAHFINEKGDPLFKVKWEGYDKKSDQTWEPEDNLRENASDVLEEYFNSLGGRAKLFDDYSAAVKGKKRGRASSGTPTAGKKAKKNTEHPASTEAPATAKAATWKPPIGSWEHEVLSLDACEDEESGKLMVYLTWRNGYKTQHETSVIYKHCPQKMLQFYERHVRIIKNSPGKAEQNGSSR